MRSLALPGPEPFALAYLAAQHLLAPGRNGRRGDYAGYARCCGRGTRLVTDVDHPLACRRQLSAMTLTLYWKMSCDPALGETIPPVHGL
ncbi:MAG: hypothetical protein IPH95_08460 [Candidatus Promineofilum sp.]|nr:hypothetical protein [Promineifilum sp.]